MTYIVILAELAIEIAAREKDSTAAADANQYRFFAEMRCGGRYPCGCVGSAEAEFAGGAVNIAFAGAQSAAFQYLTQLEYVFGNIIHSFIVELNRSLALPAPWIDRQ